MGVSPKDMDDPSQVPQFKVSLRSTTGKFLVVFDVSPQLTESGAVQYDKLTITHMPGNILVYKNTESREFGLNDVKLISRTPAEARKNLIRLNTLKAWRMPYFGTAGSQAQQLQTQIGARQIQTTGDVRAIDNLTAQLTAIKSQFLSFLGAPPDVLYLSAYAGSGAQGTFEGNINSVPVVLTNLTFTYPNDVDYIPTGGIGGQSQDNFVGTPFPTVISLTITLTEIHSPQEFQTFSLDDYRRGNLARF